jgi:hypothetical protein
MPLSVKIRDENGKSEGEPWWHVRSTRLLCTEAPGTICLRFIDPYGDTTFNQLQLPVLVGEIEALADATPGTEDRGVLADLLAFLDKARDQAHTYVTFIGD